MLTNVLFIIFDKVLHIYQNVRIFVENFTFKFHTFKPSNFWFCHGGDILGKGWGSPLDVDSVPVYWPGDGRLAAPKSLLPYFATASHWGWSIYST